MSIDFYQKQMAEYRARTSTGSGTATIYGTLPGKDGNPVAVDVTLPAKYANGTIIGSSKIRYLS